MSDLLQIAEMAASTLQIGRYVTVALYTLLLYEWISMLEDEYTLIHCSRWTSVKFAFFVCRYYPLLTWPVFIWAWVGNHDPGLCARIVHPLYSCLIPFQLSAQGVMAIRAYAFTGRNKAALFFLCVAYMMLVAAEIWVFGTNVISMPPGPLDPILGHIGCIRSQGSGVFSTPIRTGMLLMTAFFVDLVCCLVILLHCIRIRSIQGPLGETFLKQGLSAFGVMTIVHFGAASLAFRFRWLVALFSRRPWSCQLLWHVDCE